MLRLRAALNRWRRRLVRGLQFRVLFGERSQGRDLPHTRISPSTCIECEDRLVLGDHVYVGHFNLLDASGGLTLDEGVQITSHCAIVTHSSHRSQRLLGRAFATWPGPGERPGRIGDSAKEIDLGDGRIGAHQHPPRRDQRGARWP